ncbi:acetylornithine deacetylase/succinyl-diaminopimelate desuccinylase-like protein [Bradyrhizobium elkanii]
MSSNPFEAAVILDGIRRWVEIESPTERPDQVNKLADLVASGYRDLSVSVDRVAGRDGCGDHLVTRSSWGQGVPGILVLSHLDTVHPMGFIERLPFKVEGNRAFGPGIRAGPGCLDSAPLDLSGFLPGYAERGALRFCRCVGRA